MLFILPFVYSYLTQTIKSEEVAKDAGISSGNGECMATAHGVGRIFEVTSRYCAKMGFTSFAAAKAVAKDRDKWRQLIFSRKTTEVLFWRKQI